jgi:hypothetical protein
MSGEVLTDHHFSDPRDLPKLQRDFPKCEKQPTPPQNPLRAANSRWGNWLSGAGWRSAEIQGVDGECAERFVGGFEQELERREPL